MNIKVEPNIHSKVRRDFIDHHRFTSPEFAALEREKLWPVVWQWACREEDIPQVGDYYVYDIADQSIIVVRTEKDKIEAFHNVCPHRGRRLLSGQGKITKFHCIFHAWQWDLHGNNTRVLDQEQWEGCPNMTKEDLALARVHVDRWGGFIFINMSENPESFDDFIKPAAEALDILKLEDMRYAFHSVIKVKSNWKVAQEAFMESYHVWGTHPQFTSVYDEMSVSFARGKHGYHNATMELPPGQPSRRLNKDAYNLDELRENFAKFIEVFGEQIGLGEGDGQCTARSIRVGAAALRGLPSGTDVETFAGTAIMAMKDAAEKDGAYFPMVSPEQREKLGVDWNIFPTLGLVFAFDGSLVFRGKPDPDDPFNPDVCIIEMAGIVHWGRNVPTVEKFYITDWRSQHKDKIPTLLVQDLSNMEDVQKGMHSIGLKGLRPNPVQEVQISHFHEVLNEYLFD